MTDEQKRIVEVLTDQAKDKDLLDNNDGDIFADDARNLRAAVNLIEQLTAEIEQVKRERDAAIHDLQKNNQSR